jgi:acetolactate synthase-1/2/3 large subunit
VFAEMVRRKAGVVHPVDLLAAIQRVYVDGTDMPVIADASSAMFWAVRHLSFKSPGRFFVEGHFGAMGQAGAAVVGAASGRGGPAAAICGDGSLHMQDEISTAVRYGIPAIWIVLNDSGLGIVRAGMRLNNRPLHDADFPPANFADVARAKGARAVRVTSADDLDAALRAALEANGPFVVDVLVDQDAVPPIEARTKR